MRARIMMQRPTSLLAALLATALIVTTAGAAEASVRSVMPDGGSQSLSAQVIGAYKSSSGMQVRSQLASVFSDPALPAAAKALLQSDGPTGRNDLTGFQKDILKALISETSASSTLAAEISGKRLTWMQWLESLRLREQLRSNPAISTLARAGWQLGRSSQLSADIATAATNNSVSYSAFTPPATANQGGSAALDKVLGDLATLRTGSAFSSYASLLTPILQDSNFSELLKRQPALDIAAFVPASTLITLLIPNDHDPAITDVVKASLEILGGVAAIGAAILLAPEELTVAVGVGVGLAIFAGFSAYAVGVIDLSTALDCDHDGDPFDSADTPGQEC